MREIKAREKARKRADEETKAKLWVEQHPEYMLVRRDGRLYTELRPQEEEPKPEAAPKQKSHATTSASARAWNARER